MDRKNTGADPLSSSSSSHGHVVSKKRGLWKPVRRYSAFPGLAGHRRGDARAAPLERACSLAPLRRSNTLMRLLILTTTARRLGNIEPVLQKIPMPPKEVLLTKEYWKKARGKLKTDKDSLPPLPRKLKGFVYRTGKSWKLRATAYVGEPGRMNPDDLPKGPLRKQTLSEITETEVKLVIKLYTFPYGAPTVSQGCRQS